MGEADKNKVQYPTADAWTYAVARLKSEAKLPALNITALETAVAEAISLYDKIRQEKSASLTHAKTKAVMKKANELLFKLTFFLQSQETRTALGELNASTQLAELLSFSAVEEITGRSGRISHVPLGKTSSLKMELDDGKGAQFLSELDRQFTTERKSALGDATASAMLYTVQKLQKPIEDWMSRHAKNSGGRPVKTARQAVFYCLMKHYEAIMNRPLQPDSQQHLTTLATHLFPACKISNAGIEEASARAFDEFASWAAWNNFPPPTVLLGPVDIEAIPDDQEAPLVPAKPRSKK